MITKIFSFDIKRSLKFNIIFLIIILSNCIFNKKNTINLKSYSNLELENLKEENIIKVREDTKKRKNVLTYYFGEELIRKKVNWKGKEDYKIILKGGATIVHEGTQVTAPYIELDPDNNGAILGGLIVFLPDQNVYLFADKGIYNREEEIIKISGNPYMKLVSKDSNILVATEEIERNIAEKKVVFKKYVKIFSKDWSLFADESNYYDEKKEFILKENPILVGKEIYLTAKEISYKSDERKIIADKAPLIITTIQSNKKLKSSENQKDKSQNFSENSNKNNQEKEEENLVITADSIEYFFKEENSINENLVQKGIVKGNVLMTSETKTFKGEEFFLLGKKISFIESKKKVIVEDKKENFFLQSNYMLYDLTKRYLVLKQKPELIIFEKEKNEITPISKEKEVKEKLVAEIIERNFDKEITIAKGNVHFKRKEEEAFSEYAKIFEKEERMELLGNPILRRGKTEIQCKKIYVYKDKIEINGELQTKIYD